MFAQATQIIASAPAVVAQRQPESPEEANVTVQFDYPFVCVNDLTVPASQNRGVCNYHPTHFTFVDGEVYSFDLIVDRYTNEVRTAWFNDRFSGISLHLNAEQFNHNFHL